MRPFFTSLIAIRHESYCLLFAFLIGLIGTSTTLGQSLPAGFNVSKTGDGYAQPTGLTFNGQQLVVWDKAGRVWVSTWNGTQYVKQTTPVLNIAPEVGNWRDLGLLSVALDPNFASNGFVYLFYSVDRHHLINFGTASYSATTDTYFNASICRLTRYRLVQTNGVFTADPASRKILIGETKSTGIPIVYEAHAGGTILFGRDGSLLLSTGDNAGSATPDKGSSPGTYYQQALTDSIIRPAENVGSFRSQMLTSLCGKVLRIDPNTGDGIASNPFYEGSNPRSARSRVWALGFRSAFRMTLQGGTGSTNPADGDPGTLLVGDVGSGIWEDLHIIRAGGENAGWPLYEGITPSYNFPDFAKTLENKDEPNPNAGPPDATCNKPYLTFADLLRPAPVSATAVATNPCGTTPLPGPQRRYFHSPPALDWNHGAANARTPTFSGTVATATTISLNSTVCAGNPFLGVCAVGGAWYPTNGVFPTAWHNTLFFADYGSNWIRAATLNANGGISQVREFLPNNGGNGIVDVAYNPLDGGLYFLNIATGEVKKISYGGNQPPVVVATANPQTGSSPLSVTFTGSNSTDPDGDPLTYEWTFSDGTTSTLASPVRVFTSAPDAQGVVIQNYTAQLAVTDDKGLRSVSPLIRISLDNPAPTARISNPLNNALYPLDRESQYQLTATVTDDAPTSLSYAWQVTLRHNNHEHREPVLTTASPTITISPVGCDGETYYYVVKLTVTDRGGLTASDSVKIYPDCNSANLAISNLQATTLTNSVQLNWTNPSIPFDNVLVVAKAGSGFSDRPTDLVYTADASFTGSGAAFFGGKVVYQGVATGLVVTNLTPGQLYYFRVYTRRGTAWTGGVETSAILAAPTNPPVSTSLTPVAGTCYRLVARVSGKVLGVENGSLNDGATIRQRTDANLASQQWRFAPTDDGFYQVIAQHSGKVLDVLYGLTDDNTPLQQWSYGGAYGQQWLLRYDAQGYYQLVARHSNKVLDVQGGNQDEGGAVVQNTANGSQAQQWSIEQRACSNTTTPPPPPPPAPVCGLSNASMTNVACNNNATPTVTTDDYVTFTLNPTGTNLGGSYSVSVSSGTVTPTTANYGVATTFRLQNGSAGTGNPTLTVRDVSSSTCTVSIVLTNPGVCSTTPTTPPVSTSLTPVAGACYRIVARASGKVLGVENGSTADGGAVRQRTDANQAWQQWKFVVTSNNFYQVVANHSGKVLEVTGASLNNEIPVRQATYSGGNHQQWTLRQDAQGYYQLVARHSGSMLDLFALNQNEGGVVNQYAANNSQAQQWLVEPRTCVNPPAPPPPVCGLSNAGLANVACNNNATPTVTTDDYVTFTLNPTGTNLGGSYSVSVSSGTVTPTTANYGVATTFRLQNGSAGTGNPTLIVRDVTSSTCTVSAVLTNPGVCSTTPTAPPVSTSLTPVAGNCYRIVSRVSGKVMGVENASLADGGLIRQRTDANLASQQWKFVVTSNGYYQLVANHSGKIIDVANAATTDNATIHQWGWWGGTNQQWRLRYDAQGYYQIQALHSGKMLDVQNSNQTEGGVITQFTANGTQAQQWSIEPRTCVNTAPATTFVSTACYRISARNGGRAVSVLNGATNDGASIRQQAYAGRASQQWRIVTTTNGFHRITNVNSSKSIDVPNASTADYVNLVQWGYGGGANQQWKLTRDTQGFFVVTARHSGKAMDQRDGNASENVEIIQYAVNGTAAQQWTIQAVTCAAPGARVAGDGFVIPTFDSVTESDASAFSLYPNPAQNSVTVDLRAANGQPAELSLTDLTGRVLYQKCVETATEPRHTLSTTAYSDGVYLISVRVDGAGVRSLRLLIAR